MKLSKKLSVAAFVVAMIISACLSAAAQTQTFDDQALINLRKKSAEQMKDRNLRITTTEERFENNDKNPVKFEKSIHEMIPPDRNRSVSETRTAKGVERTEYINIGGKRFVKENDGEWKEFNSIANGIGSGGGNGISDSVQPKVESTVSKILKKGESVNNQTADLYETVVTKKFIFPGKTYTEISTEAFWFDGGGKLLKSLYEFQDGEAKTVSRTTQGYEYDPKLRIEPPMIKGKKENPK